MPKVLVDKTITIKVDRELSAEFVGDVLVTAFDGQYGACWSWSEPAGRFTVESEGDVWTDVHFKPEETGVAIIDNALFFTANGEMVRIGIQRILDGDVQIGKSIRDHIVAGVLEEDAGEIDAIGADCIIQAGCFKELIF